ncbi:M14-type cytosolic carboxypeptidase [Thalassotalea ponticola]|uniref:M14 family metallopeptidase n=1 Tax=Thalassotalea ponticola TaxID=1523392 RepID=UPI0025B5717C|nr:M14-type cytosolic carboxypeptidase [Thalassotalea ponticola]MDN3653929.1 M14-type cytosolic carboxypeptidase [Thalassotalea ponticola]
MKLLFRLCYLLCFFQVTADACEAGGIKVNTDFDGASSANLLTECMIDIENQHIRLTFQPENTPINNSPWYAFKISSQQPQNVSVKISIVNGSHRYHPKYSVDGKHWLPLTFTTSDEYLEFKLHSAKHPVWLAAQELITNNDYHLWAKELATHFDIKTSVLGYSVQQRPILKLISDIPQSNKWVILVGRQHPPEVTGAMALFSFAETLLSTSTLAQSFRREHNIMILPNINPDGVALGYWRHNANGVDLNRDWQAFKQPEVKAVDDALSELTTKGHHIVMAVDFHSTHNDIFYTMPHDYGIKQPYLVKNWLNLLDSKYVDFNVIQRPGNNPDRGVFKQYIADTYKVHAITYEMGDHTDRAFIKQFAVDAANTFMQSMLTAQHDQLHLIAKPND